MDHFEIEKCLESMEIIVDSREQPTDAAERRYKSFGVPYKRATLDYGDYAINCTMPSGKSLYGYEGRVCADVVVERKMSLDELALCFGKERRRFLKEFERAAEHNARIYLLIENSTWEKLFNGSYRSKLNPNAFSASLLSWSARFNMIPIMCRSTTSGRLIHDILYRELKERLENGKYDQILYEAKSDQGNLCDQD